MWVHYICVLATQNTPDTLHPQRAISGLNTVLKDWQEQKLSGEIRENTFSRTTEMLSASFCHNHIKDHVPLRNHWK